MNKMLILLKIMKVYVFYISNEIIAYFIFNSFYSVFTRISAICLLNNLTNKQMTIITLFVLLFLINNTFFSYDINEIYSINWHTVFQWLVNFCFDLNYDYFKNYTTGPFVLDKVAEVESRLFVCKWIISMRKLIYIYFNDYNVYF